jgi:hypothetical protein
MIHSITNSAVLITSPFPSHKHQLGDFFNRHRHYHSLLAKENNCVKERKQTIHPNASPEILAGERF